MEINNPTLFKRKKNIKKVTKVNDRQMKYFLKQLQLRREKSFV